jgi:tRNA(Ile)-lysidine synthase
MDLRARVQRALHALGVEPDSAIGIACSGGADSIALVHLLADRPDVAVLHVDHHLREGSHADAAFVRDVADRLGVRFTRRDVVITSTPDGVEAAARGARYGALEAMAVQLGLSHVLTAHTMDDQAETVLLRLMRGGSLDGIAPVRGRFVRPLLGVRCDELRAWLTARGETWREDPTNGDTAYDRNWVRHVLLPQMQERRPGVATVLARTAARIHEGEAVLDALATAALADARSDDVGLLVQSFAALPSAVAARVVRRACRELGGDASDREVDAAIASEHHVRCGGVDVWRLGADVAFVRSPMPVPDSVPLPPSGEVALRTWGVRIAVDEASQGLHVRSRRPGDRVQTTVGHRKVQDILVDEKVPRPLRPLVPILAAPEGAIAVIGGRAHRLHSEAFGMAVEPFDQTWSRELAWIR